MSSGFRCKHTHVRADKLHQVLVFRDQRNFKAFRNGFLCQVSDDIIRFQSAFLQLDNVKHLNKLMNERYL